MTQRELAKLLGLSESGVSLGLRGLNKDGSARNSGTPLFLKAAVVAWEIMTPDQRREWLARVERERGDPTAS